jgi:uncharacterized cupredoxin-like copper-binding protein
MDRLLTRTMIAVAVFTMVAVVACSSSSSSSAAAGSGSGGVSATEMDFSIGLSPSTGSPGQVTFNVSNQGPSTHEFVVIKTNDAPDALPVQNGAVNEAGLTIVDENEGVPPSTTATLSVNLQAGSYVIICNVPGHYQAGMNTGFTVS